ncbi:MAG: hypothetical protein KKC99_09175 [Proteobacteria bacterium]|nr:hypothetical protein [Pseudomonadota bacterium]
MKIGSFEQQALNILTPENRVARNKAETQVAESNREAARADPMQGMNIDFSKLGEAHSLDADRVAALIADPFGDE